MWHDPRRTEKAEASIPPSDGNDFFRFVERTMRSDFAERVIEQVEEVVLAAEEATRPLEVEPYRGRLFAVFVLAYRAGGMQPDSAIDLSADALCRDLGARWGLANAARDAGDATGMNPQHVHKMRLLWSTMRLWMEWTYAWNRWAEFHSSEAHESGSVRSIPPKG